MRIIERGAGATLVVIPGLQGRWEYIGPAVEALSACFHVITFPLCDEPSADFSFDSGRGFSCYVDQVRAGLDQVRADRAIVCGISFGGVVALRFAASHQDRTRGLVLASTPGPGWHLRRRHEIYARMPLLLGPLFLAETPWRLRREMTTAFPALAERWHFTISQLKILGTAPLSLARMAARARMLSTIDAAADCTRVAAPTLVITGERALDHVVPVDGSAGYVSRIRGARGVVLPRTGHLGLITRPREFAAIVHDFAVTRGLSASRQSRVPTDATAVAGPPGPGLHSGVA